METGKETLNQQNKDSHLRHYEIKNIKDTLSNSELYLVEVSVKQNGIIGKAFKLKQIAVQNIL